MKHSFEILPIEESNEKEFLDFLDKDRILHIFTIYDLKYMRNKTQVWIALKNKEICGYIFEFDKRIVHTHGTADSVAELLKCIDLDDPVMVIKPHHLGIVKEFFEPVKPTDSSSKSRITVYLVMKTDAETFRPLIRHRVKKLGRKDFNEVSKYLGEEWKNRVENAIYRGITFGAYKKNALASIATVPEIIDGVALIRGVYTAPSIRGKGLATSVSSALVKELISRSKEVMLWVAKDNLPARKVYEKIGFQHTKHLLLGFKAKRL